MTDPKKISSVIFMLAMIVLIACEAGGTSTGGGNQSGTELIIPGLATGEEFGTSVDFLGDFNGDGRGDIAVGAAKNSQTDQKAGAVYLFLDITNRDSKPIKITGTPQALLGTQVLGPGDLNRDGFDDLVVSAPGINRVFIYLGRDSLLGGEVLALTQASMEITGLDSGFVGSNLTALGVSLSSAGDINHDGLLDLAMGGSSADERGLVYIFLGGRSLGLLHPSNRPLLDAADAELRLRGSIGAKLGTSLSHVGDVNGDFGTASSATNKFGDDLLIGAPGIVSAYLVLGLQARSGAFEIDSAPLTKKITQAGRTNFGQSVSAVGDIQGDRLDEYAVGYNGGVFVYRGFGQVGFIAGFELEIFSNTADDEFGAAVSGGRGALIGGGTALVVGAPADSFLGPQSGAAYFIAASVLSDFFVLSTSVAVEGLSTTPIRGNDATPNLSRRLGNSLKWGGDLNADGRSDRLIGMPLFDGSGLNQGGILVEF